MGSRETTPRPDKDIGQTKKTEEPPKKFDHSRAMYEDRTIKSEPRKIDHVESPEEELSQHKIEIDRVMQKVLKLGNSVSEQTSIKLQDLHLKYKDAFEQPLPLDAQRTKIKMLRDELISYEPFLQEIAQQQAVIARYRFDEQRRDGSLFGSFNHPEPWS